jgi:hypothetical protein
VSMHDREDQLTGAISDGNTSIAVGLANAGTFHSEDFALPTPVGPANHADPATWLGGHEAVPLLD